MSSDSSTSSQLSPSFSHIALGRQQGKSIPESTPLATPRLSQTGIYSQRYDKTKLLSHALILHRGAERQLLFRTPQTPADTVLNHFRVVRCADIGCACSCILLDDPISEYWYAGSRIRSYRVRDTMPCSVSVTIMPVLP